MRIALTHKPVRQSRRVKYFLVRQTFVFRPRFHIPPLKSNLQINSSLFFSKIIIDFCFKLTFVINSFTLDSKPPFISMSLEITDNKIFIQSDIIFGSDSSFGWVWDWYGDDLSVIHIHLLTKAVVGQQNVICVKNKCVRVKTEINCSHYFRRIFFTRLTIGISKISNSKLKLI